MPDLVLGSADGGANWEVSHRGRPTNDSLGLLMGVAFGDTRHGWAVRRGSHHEDAAILATADGGKTWAWRYRLPQTRFLAVAAIGDTHAWAVGNRGSDRETKGAVLATDDGGATWTQQSIPSQIEPVDVAFADVDHGWILGFDEYRLEGCVLSTVDGGEHWQPSFRTKAARLSRLTCSGSRRCWVVGSTEEKGYRTPGFLAMTSDGGATWSTRHDLTKQPLNDVAFPDAQHGCAVGELGTIVTTSDGGATWTKRPTGRRFSLGAVAFSDTAHGWALIGHYGLLATADGGTTWTVVRPAETPDALLQAITCLGPERVTSP